MTTPRLLAALLAALMVVASATQALSGQATTASPVWTGFLYGLPLILAGFLLAGHRWALMGAVMYGTVGLALDLSTMVQELTRGGGRGGVLVAGGVTGLLNFLLIVLGGRGVLTHGPATRPPGAPPPNPPRPSST